MTLRALLLTAPLLMPLGAAEEAPAPLIPRAFLLIAQGANDVQVRLDQSDRMVQALREAGREVEYVVYDGEGHKLPHPANRLDFHGRAEAFLARHLGGRAEPYAPVPGATVRK